MAFNVAVWSAFISWNGEKEEEGEEEEKEDGGSKKSNKVDNRVEKAVN